MKDLDSYLEEAVDNEKMPNANRFFWLSVEASSETIESTCENKSATV